MRNFYLCWPSGQIYQSLSDKSLPPQIPLAVPGDFFTAAADGKQYRTRHHNPDIISVGYRVIRKAIKLRSFTHA